MTVTNDFLAFCTTDTGTNLLSEADYTASPNLPIGNQPGIASSKLNNKVLRQASAIISQIAQFVANVTQTNVLDDANSTKLLSQMFSALDRKAPIVNAYSSSSGNWNMPYKFQIVSGNATAGATYTNNSVTYTVVTTISAGLELIATGAGDPTTSGTLTKASGTGDATITFNAFRKPISLHIIAVGGGGGGGGSASVAGNNGGTGGAGGNTTFGTSGIVCGGGGGGGGTENALAGGGGSAALGSIGAVGLAIPGGTGASVSFGGSGEAQSGAGGGASAFGGGGAGGASNAGTGGNGVGASGGGGGGAGSPTSGIAGAAGGAGGYVNCVITSPLSTYAYAIGAGGTAGANGTSGNTGGVGGGGSLMVISNYQ